MRIAEVEVYKFEELSEEVKNKVIEAFREKEDTPFLYDDLHESLVYDLKENKIHVRDTNDLKMYYSLGYSQGDGLCFVGRFKWKNYYITIEHSSHYYHEYSTSIYITTNYGNDAKEEVYEEFKELYYSICVKLKKYGYDYIEDATSDESIKENIKVNEYEFYKNGEIF